MEIKKELKWFYIERGFVYYNGMHKWEKKGEKEKHEPSELTKYLKKEISEMDIEKINVKIGTLWRLTSEKIEIMGKKEILMGMGYISKGKQQFIFIDNQHG